MKKNVFRVAEAALLVCAATAAAYADTTIANNITLTADADWRADGVVTVPQGVTVDLNGHTLWVSGLAGAGTFTSAVPDPTTFDLTTAQMDATRVKSYSGGTDQALGTEFTFTIQPAWKLFADYESYDFVANHRAITAFDSSNPTPVDIVYEFDSATTLNAYKIQVTSIEDTYLGRAPKTWKFFGSVSGEDNTWVELDSRENVTDWAIYENRQFTFFNDNAYKYYRLRILANGGGASGSVLEFFKLEYGRVQNQVRLVPSQNDGFAAASNAVSGTAKFVVAGGKISANVDLRGLGKVTLGADEMLDLAGHYLKVHAIDGTGKVRTSDVSEFADLTSPSDRTRATSTVNGTVVVMAGNDKYPASAAFDDDTTTRTTGDAANPCSFVFCNDFSSNGLEINYDFGEATYVNRYRIYGSGSTMYTSVPKSWAFEGSNDGGTTWTTLDSRFGQSLPFAAYADYTFDNSESYSKYRLRITAVAGTGQDAAKCYIYELEFGAIPYNAIYLDPTGVAASDFSGIAVAGDAHFAIAEGDAIVLSDNLNLSKFAIDGTIDLRGHTLTVDRLEGRGTITDTLSSPDKTDSDATRVWSPNTYFSSNAGTAKDAFANEIEPSRTGIRVMAEESQLPIVIDNDFRTATVVDSYRLTAGDNVRRAPGEWELFGSNDDAAYMSGELSAWTRLDTHFGETWSATFETRDFCFANATPYRYYRMRFTKSAVQGNGFLTFWKLQYCNTADRGHLRIVVPDGPAAYNRTVSLTGNLRLVKDGAGIFVAMKTGQTYNGGTDVVAGRLTLGAQGDTMPLGARDGDITVRKNALVDLNGNANFQWYGFTLDGGTLKHRGTAYNSLTPMLKRMRLTDDSDLVVENDYGFVGENNVDAQTFVDLGGHTLVLQIAPGKYFRNYNTTYLNGVVDIITGGWFLTGGNYVTALDVDFKVNCALDVASPFQVRGYEANFYSTTSNNRDAPMNVSGVFKPTVAAYYGCTMLAGSTMDLTAWPKTAGWPMASAFTTGKTNLEFADSGEITVNLAGRDDLKALARSANPRLFTWPLADGDPVMPGADFVLDPATAAAGFRVRKDATGLRLIYTKGMMLIVK